MAKIGAKESALRELRERNASPFVFDKQKIKDARAAVEAEAKRKFESELAKALKPYQDELARLTKLESDTNDFLTEIASQIVDVQKAIAGLNDAPAPKARGGTSSGGRKARTSSGDMEAATSAVLKALSKTFASKSDIFKAAGVDAAAGNSVLAKLKRDKKAVSNGKRGVGGAWKAA